MKNKNWLLIFNFHFSRNTEKRKWQSAFNFHIFRNWKSMFDFLSFLNIEKWKMKICGQIFFFWLKNGNETRKWARKLRKTTNHDTTDSREIAVICFFKSTSILFEYFCCSGRRLYYFRMKSRKTSGKKEGDSVEIGTNVWSKSCRRLL